MSMKEWTSVVARHEKEPASSDIAGQPRISLSCRNSSSNSISDSGAVIRSGCTQPLLYIRQHRQPRNSRLGAGRKWLRHQITRFLASALSCLVRGRLPLDNGGVRMQAAHVRMEWWRAVASRRRLAFFRMYVDSLKGGAICNTQQRSGRSYWLSRSCWSQPQGFGEVNASPLKFSLTWAP